MIDNQRRGDFQLPNGGDNRLHGRGQQSMRSLTQQHYLDQVGSLRSNNRPVRADYSAQNNLEDEVLMDDLTGKILDLMKSL